MSESYKIQLADGAGELTIASWEDIEQYVDLVQGHWGWLIDPNGSEVQKTVTHSLSAAIGQVRANIRTHRHNGWGLSAGENLLRAAFEERGSVLVHPESQTAFDIADMRAGLSDEAAVFGYGFLRKVLNLSQAQSADHIRAALWLAAPGYAAHGELADLLRSERANLRSTVRRLNDEVGQERIKREEDWGLLLGIMKVEGVKWARTRSRRWRAKARRWEERHQASEKSVHDVDALYREAMKLKGPVQYWTAKAEIHRTAENAARQRLYWYFPLALIFLVALFAVGGSVILNTPKDDLHPGALFVASAGLAAISGLLFWIGRLLTKLYLSEHHLRHDAEERAVMTTTYLALIVESGAVESDRQIVLNALFRSTPDGIVKEEGGLDPSIGALIAKAMVR
jgi:hypothetical protein